MKSLARKVDHILHSHGCCSHLWCPSHQEQYATSAVWGSASEFESRPTYHRLIPDYSGVDKRSNSGTLFHSGTFVHGAVQFARGSSARGSSVSFRVRRSVVCVAQHDDLRAIIASIFVETGKEIGKEMAVRRQAEKNAWITEARRTFSPGDRSSCFVCGKYPYLTHAHHIYPLAQQYDDGLRVPNDGHVWLCPNHHAMVHMVLDAPIDRREAGRRLASPVLDLSGDELTKLLQIVAFDRIVVRR